jgi:ATP-binding cassette subfamily B protein/subfamily B ATP-binding cassette protein MsbA
VVQVRRKPKGGGVEAVRISRLLARFWPYTRGLRGRMALICVLVLLAPALSAATIWLFKLLVDEVLVPHDFRVFPQIALAYAAITLLDGLISFVDQTLSTRVSEELVLRVRSTLFKHLHDQSPGFFEQRELGDVLSRLTGDTGAIEELLLSGSAQLLTYVAQIVIYTVAMFMLDWRLAGIALIAAPAFLVVARLVSTRLRTLSLERRRLAGTMISVAEESLANAPLVRVFDRADAERERFDSEQRAALKVTMRTARLQALFGPVTDLLQVVGVLGVAAFAVGELASGELTLGGLLVFVGYLTQLYGPVQGLGGLLQSAYAAAAGAERVVELLDLDPELDEPAGAAAAPGPGRGALELRGIRVQYPGADAPALAGLDLVIPAGQHVAIVGESGAGKSTLVKLLLRLRDPDEGSVRLDGRPLDEIPSEQLRREITAVLQDPYVVDASVADNIRWGRPEASEAQVRAAARVADADSFVSRLPAGFATRIGQRGRLLSGGQRQRLAITRAVLRDAPVLVLDEPTSGLDPATARRVLARVAAARRGRTTVLITHDRAALGFADRVVTLDRGAVARPVRPPAPPRPAVRREPPVAATTPIVREPPTTRIPLPRLGPGSAHRRRPPHPWHAR